MEEELAKKIDAIAMQELALSIYAKHLQAALFWSDLSKPAREQIIQHLKIIEKESREQSNVLQEIKLMTKDQKSNV